MGELAAGDRIRLLSIARESLVAGGYQPSRIASDWIFADVFERAEPDRSVDIAAFGQDPPSYRTACWGVTFGTDDDIANLRALGAPQVLQLEFDSIKRWKIRPTDAPELQDRISPDRLVELFTDHRAEWGPRTVLRIKSVAFDPSPRQLDFYDLGLIPAIDGVVFRKLDVVLRDALALAQHGLAEHSSDAPNPRQLVRLVFRLLAAKVFSDRDYPGATSVTDPAKALELARTIYGEYDDTEPIVQDPRVQELVWRRIHSAFNLRNISVEALAHVYENTLVSAEHRRITGTHATPPFVAEYVTQKLPFESLAEQHRVIFEPFAGHAAFLVAALNRLRELLPSDLSNDKRHRYLKRSLAGVEIDPFAVEVAKLSLLLADYPNPNGWNVRSGDVFNDPIAQHLLTSSSVVLCNPPFEWFDQETRKRYQRIKIPNPMVEILARALVSGPELLGFVLPWSFLEGQSFREARRILVRKYGQVEIISLPDSLFAHSKAQSIILLAHDRTSTSTTVRSAAVKRADLRKFAVTGAPSWVVESPVERVGSVPQLWHHPLSRLWKCLDKLQILGSVAEIHNGVEYNISTKQHAQLVQSTEPQAGFQRGLFRVGPGYEQYHAANITHLNLDEDLMLYKAYRLPWRTPKVILNAARMSRGPWRLAAVPDKSGLVCYHRFHGVWPKGESPVELIAAVLNGYVANAFVGLDNASRDNTIARLKSIPFPDFTASDSQMIVDLVGQYQEKRAGLSGVMVDASAQRECIDLLQRIDHMVLAAYKLPVSLEAALLEAFSDQQRPVFPGGYRQTSLEVPGDPDADPIPQIRAVLGEWLTDFIVGLVERTSKHQTERALSTVTADVRLSTALEIVKLLEEFEAADTIQAWFVGKNPMLADRSPAATLVDDPHAVLRAAREFAAYG